MNVTFPFKTRRPAARNDSTEIADRIAWVEEWSKTDTNCLKNCVFFFDETGFDINMRPPGGRSTKGISAIVTISSTRATSQS
jgi:hypothetical protein